MASCKQYSLGRSHTSALLEVLVGIPVNTLQIARTKDPADSGHREEAETDEGYAPRVEEGYPYTAADGDEHADGRFEAEVDSLKFFVAESLYQLHIRDVRGQAGADSPRGTVRRIEVAHLRVRSAQEKPRERSHYERLYFSIAERASQRQHRGEMNAGK